MPRRKRLEVPGLPHHIVQRGVNRQPVFLDQDCYRHYLRRLELAAKERQVAVHAWCLMTNHVHLLVTPSCKGAMGRMMQDVNRAYVAAVNTRFDRSGHLWSGRFFASVVDERAYFFCCMRYIELNPVRAGLVGSPEEYPWSSWHSNALGRGSSLITEHAEYLALGAAPAERQARYRRDALPDQNSQILDALRGATRQNAAFGSENFVSRLQATVPNPLVTRPRGRPRKG